MAKQRTPPGNDDASTGDDDLALHDTLAFRAAVRDVKPLAQTPEPKGLAKTRPRTRVRKAAPTGDSLDLLMPLLPVPPAVSDEAPSGASQTAEPGVRSRAPRPITHSVGTRSATKMWLT